MVKFEAELMLLGHWKNFDELEDSLTLEELMVLLDAYREQRHEDKRFAAGIQGHEIGAYGSGSNEKRFEEIKRRAAAKAVGVHPEAIELGGIGIGFEDE